MLKILYNNTHNKFLLRNSPKFVFFRCLECCHKNTFNYRIFEFFENSLYKEKCQNNYYIDTSPALAHQQTINTDIKFESKPWPKTLNCIQNYVNILTNETDSDLRMKTFEKLNMECFSLLHKMSPTELLKLLCVLLKSIPEKMVSSFLYQKSIAILLKAVKDGSLKSTEIVQLVYCISHGKKSVKKNIETIVEYLPSFEDITQFEVGIIALACFKTSVKLNKKQTLFIENILENNAKELMKDFHLLVALCKSLRHNRPSDNLNLTTLSDEISQSDVSMRLSTATHILLLYAEGHFVYPKAINRLINDSLKELLSENLRDQVRIKHATSFLRALSRLNCKLSIHEKEVLKQFVNDQFHKYQNELDLLINTCLSFIMLNINCKQMCVYCIHSNILLPALKIESNKVKSRLRLLLRMVEIIYGYKASHLYSILKLPTPGFVIPQYLLQTYMAMLGLADEMKFYNVEIGCPVKEISIPGITFWHNHTKYHIDVMSEKVLLKGTNIPHGLMNLKLRLLKIMRYQCIQIDGKYFLQEDPKINALIMEQIKTKMNVQTSLQLLQ